MFNLLNCKYILISLFISFAQAHSEEQVICDYFGVHSYMSGEQYVEWTTLKCNVLKTGEDFIKVDCTKDFLKHSTNTNGVGMVQNHKLNKRIFWASKERCYGK